MKARRPLFVMLGGSLTLLVSLYMAWVSTGRSAIQDFFNTGKGSAGALSLLNLFSFSDQFSANGWGTFGQAAAIAAVGLALCAVVSLIRPELEAADCLSAAARSRSQPSRSSTRPRPGLRAPHTVDSTCTSAPGRTWEEPRH